MNFALLPPRYQLVEILTRIYNQRLTTVSGGNLSIRDTNGDVWITPASIDKGALSVEDIVCVRQDGTIIGRHSPSSEYPFHRLIYDTRPDIQALVHAHPPALVAFSIVRQVPNTRINPQSYEICGEAGYAPYALPGSYELGQKIADTFAEGFSTVILENHGVVTSGEHLLQAFQRMETLEFCAQINIRAAQFGNFRTLSPEEIQQFDEMHAPFPEFTPTERTSHELELRLQICKFLQRAYDRFLMTSTIGTVSARVQDNNFLITPYGMDRKYLEPHHLVMIQDNQREVGKVPSRAVNLHSTLYQQHPEINCIMSAQPPHAITYSLVYERFDTRTIPESYIVLREMPVAPYGVQYQNPDAISAMISADIPIILMQNDAVLATGSSILQAFDRVEVAEFSAQSLLSTLNIGELKPISEQDLDALKKKFFG